MTHGKFRLFVKPSSRRPWGLLEEFPYDDSARKKAERRPAQLEAARTSQAMWFYNYAQFKDAEFCVEDQWDQFQPSTHIQGTKRERKGGLPRKQPKWKSAQKGD